MYSTHTHMKKVIIISNKIYYQGVQRYSNDIHHRVCTILFRHMIRVVILENYIYLRIVGWLGGWLV